ncbi:MAG TPA: hypothetical protein VHM48_00580 [Candidatus Limnocylindrales bacterium]|nr:hypothetical protein [Candidatus Limnocylindrales bacterium]
MHRQAAFAKAVHRRPRRLGSLLACLALIAAACGSSGPSGSTAATTPATTPGVSASPTPFVDPATVYASIEDQVVAIRGLKPTTKVDPKILDDAGIKKLTADSFARDNPPATIAANERILKALGLLPADASLTDLYVNLLGSQVAGLYNPDDKTLYVVSRSGGLGPAQKTTFAHEFTHALQDQNFDIGSLKLDEIGQGDRSFARLSLVEGDATLLMSLWQIQNLTQADLGQLLAEAGSDPSTKVLLDMPPILREALLFPYTGGLSFVQGLQGSGGWQAVNDAFSKPPASTEQILHPEKYASGEAPIAVTLPKDLVTSLGGGWKVALEDSFGEFQLAVWLRGSKAIDAATANDAAAGWGGDRIALVEGPDGAWGVILRTAWDSAADAAAFEAAAASLVDGLANPASLLPGSGGAERWIVIGSDDATLNRVAGALGLAG